MSSYQHTLRKLSKAKTAIERVRELHSISVAMQDPRKCVGCDNNYPCPTIKALDDEDGMF